MAKGNATAKKHAEAKQHAMTKGHAEANKESAKKPGDKMHSTLKEMDRQGTGVGTDPIPAPESGGHEKSHAAHLGGTVHDKTKPTSDLRHGSAPGALREPPMDITRAGKQNRGR